ncbi:hypothetical protein [Jiulongibacter sediminis]|uniref:Uncharacterized protein n=1 Tax=Jiulongibacter sediminis TaxID=1605367 RepID=A0A0P7BRJ0_9BACT|nr:hypothetical protein [Jiulongibacter sediminis]KPM46929.1 hypothetical protein AFM12_16990 [Jiulongibacter sediminis]TBX22276.1 hypothetical protein TK44_17000 [Jiulongibacter sediminis]
MIQIFLIFNILYNVQVVPKRPISDETYKERIKKLEIIGKSNTSFAVLGKSSRFSRAHSKYWLEWMQDYGLVEKRFGNEMTMELRDELVEIIKTPDTTAWLPIDFPEQYVFQSFENKYSTEYIQNWESLPEVRQSELKEKLENWEISHFQKYSFLSHPVLTKDGRFGLLEFGYVCGSRCGHGWIRLYRFENEKWIYIADLGRWVS